MHDQKMRYQQNINDKKPTISTTIYDLKKTYNKAKTFTIKIAIFTVYDKKNLRYLRTFNDKYCQATCD